MGESAPFSLGAAPPPLPRARDPEGALSGSLFFRGSSKWTVAIGRHSAFPGPDAAIMLALLGDV